MTSQQEADRALAEHWAERDRKEREQRKSAVLLVKKSPQKAVTALHS